jgi:hypothetical protein
MTRSREEVDRMVETVRKHVSGEPYPDPIQEKMERERVEHKRQGGTVCMRCGGRT